MTFPAPREFPGLTLGEALAQHTRDCGKCQDAIKTPPVRIGQKTRMCSEYVEIAELYANWERDMNKGVLISVEQFIDEGDI